MDNQISQTRGDYISLYDFIEWAKETGGHQNLSDTARDILNILGTKNIALYREYRGLKPRIEKDTESLRRALGIVKLTNDYSSDEIPF